MSTDTRPHIIIATTAFTPFVGGAEVAVQETIKRLQKDFRFTIITARLDRALSTEDTWHGSRIIRVGWGLMFDKIWLILILPWLTYRLRRTQGAQIVWAIMASYAGVGACLSSYLTRIPYCLTLQEGDDLDRLEKRLGFMLPLFKKIFAHARGIHVIAPFLGDWARRMGAQSSPEVIPNGVSLDIFSLNSHERSTYRNQIRKQYGIPEDAFVVISVSRLVKKNGITDLVDAVIQLPNLYLIVVGDGQLRNELEEQARPVRDRIHFIGTRTQEELRIYAAAADIFSRPSLSEGLGIVFLEALSLGLPVVATNVGGIPSIITHGEHGLLVDPSHIDQLVHALRLLEEDSELYERLQKNASEHVKQYSWELLAPRISSWLTMCMK